jgi:exonuclease III
VRGLNDGAKRASTRNFIISSGATIVCLQETKIENWTRTQLIERIGMDMLNNCALLPASGSAGGILIAETEKYFSLEPLVTTQHTISATITMLAENISWSITGVYGPQSDPDKRLFLQEIEALKSSMQPEWLILGDFNLIY